MAPPKSGAPRGQRHPQGASLGSNGLFKVHEDGLSMVESGDMVKQQHLMGLTNVQHAGSHN